MKMQSYRRRNALVSKKTLGIASMSAVVLSLLMVICSFFPSLPLFMASPGWRLGAVASNATHSVSSLFANADQMRIEKERLEAENQVLNNENRALRARLADSTHVTGGLLASNTILAGVLATPPLSPYDTLIVALPDVASVAEGSLVYGPGSVPIGKVTQSAYGYARVLLYSSPKETTIGWIGEKRLAVTLTGESAGAFSATLARESGVAVGDVLYLPGPGALPAGTVSSVVSDPSSVQDVVHVVPYVNIYSITWVTIAPARHE